MYNLETLHCRCTMCQYLKPVESSSLIGTLSLKGENGKASRNNTAGHYILEVTGQLHKGTYSNPWGIMTALLSVIIVVLLFCTPC